VVFFSFSNNHLLRWLYCEFNQLTNLDISGCNILEHLICYNNLLTSLNVSNHTSLRLLMCQQNQLINLDISGCTSLIELNCSGNLLASLDLSTNSQLMQHWERSDGILNISEMPTLFKVCVWTMPFTPEDVPGDTIAASSPNVYFTTDCSATAFKPVELYSKINIYPNPVYEIGKFTYPSGKTISIEIYDISGLLLRTIPDQDQDGETEVDLSDFKSGVYPYRLIDEEGSVYVGKVIRE